ncbi:hypothetical protein Ocin01_17818 [Orchesella cincta]|uniref:Uncharacterized protein n=1 Tax=Orchesella cincta TaxID=48709 RepID=A0A1D2M7B8_ORCCI|nr:hypothetical protein Ocin01_17818 [Orchesella cincta]
MRSAIYMIFWVGEDYEGCFLGKQYSWFDIDTAVLLYLWTLNVHGNEDLKWMALQVFKSKLGDLEGSMEYDKLMKESPQTAKKLIALSFASHR